MEFEFRILYILSKNGLEQKVNIINKSISPMPLGLGFHTAFNVPFDPESNAADYRLIVSIDEEWKLNERTLPVGKLTALTENDKNFINKEILPQGTPIMHHYSAKSLNINNKKFNGAILSDLFKGLKLVYEVDEKYRHWVIWNETGDKGFICPEPQTWAINAPNINLLDEKTGFYLLESGKKWETLSKIFIEEINL